MEGHRVRAVSAAGCSLAKELGLQGFAEALSF